MSYDFWCFVTLIHGVVDWSAVCDCGISWLYSLTFYLLSSHSTIVIKIQKKEWDSVYSWAWGLLCNSKNTEYKSNGILTRTVLSVVVGHVVLGIHIFHSLETNRAGLISRQILVLSEHIFFQFERKRNLKYTYIVLLQLGLCLLCVPFSWRHARLACSYVCGISWLYSIIFGTIINVDDNTIVLHMIKL